MKGANESKIPVCHAKIPIRLTHEPEGAMRFATRHSISEFVFDQKPMPTKVEMTKEVIARTARIILTLLELLFQDIT